MSIDYGTYTMLGLRPSEEVIFERRLGTGGIWITNLRVIQRRRGSNYLNREIKTTGINLEDIIGISIGFIRTTRLLVIGTVVSFIGLIGGNVNPGTFATSLWLAGLVLVGAYVISGRRGLLIKSDSRVIKFPIRGMDIVEVEGFVSALEVARNSRMDSTMKIQDDSDNIR